jgi:phosphate-selective porin OprO/OprP
MRINIDGGTAQTGRTPATAKRGTLVGVLLMALAALTASADEAPNGYDKVWDVAEVYTGSEDDFFQSFALTGRLQLDLAYVESEDDDHGEFNVRRFRLGFKTVFADHFTLHLEGEFNPQEADPLYTRLTDAYLAWSPKSAVKLTAGKHSAGFTLDGMTSSKSLLTIDRSALANNMWFTEEYMPGLSVSGKASRWQYFAGIFSSGGKDPEFGDFKGGEFILLTLGYDFAEALGVDEALLRVNLVDNEPDPENDFTRPLEQIFSLNFQFKQGSWGFGGDYSDARGYGGQSDLSGLMAMIHHDRTERLQFVGRYSLVDSDDENGVRLGRYEKSLESGKGDRYDEIYLGFNYYWYGHKLKLQNGLQFVDMKDSADDGGAYSGWSWTTAVRLSW